jgi:hypothetical protein
MSGTRRLSLAGGHSKLYLTIRGDDLDVFNKSGELLDPVAAEVLISLGGPAPPWLPVVRGLKQVHRSFPADDGALVEAGQALARRRDTQNHLAKTSDQGPVLVGLAGAGFHQVSTNPHLTRREWDILLDHPDPEVAKRSRSAAAVLPQCLFDHPDPDTRVRVGRNPAVSPGVLDVLANDFDERVRNSVASNGNAASATLRRLLHDKPNSRMRRTIAANPHADFWTLQRCLRDESGDVRAAAAANPSLPRWRAMLLIGDKWSAVRLALAGRQDLPPLAVGWIERLSRRDAPTWQNMIRFRLLHNPGSNERIRSRITRFSPPHSKGLTTPDNRLPLTLRWAPPTLVEFVVLLAVLGIGFALTFTNGSWIAMALALGLAVVYILPRCRTVRPKTKVYKSRSSNAVPTGRRLTPAGPGGRFAILYRLGFVALIFIGRAGSSIASQSNGSEGTSSYSAQVGQPTTDIMPGQLRSRAAYYALSGYVSAPIAPDELPNASSAASVVANLADEAGFVLRTTGVFVQARTDAVGLVEAAYSSLQTDLEPLLQNPTVAVWDSDEEQVRTDLQSVRTAESSLCPTAC